MRQAQGGVGGKFIEATLPVGDTPWGSFCTLVTEFWPGGRPSKGLWTILGPPAPVTPPIFVAVVPVILMLAPTPRGPPGTWATLGPWPPGGKALE